MLWRKKMINKLRFRLIAAAMASLLTVLTVVMAGINILNYRAITSQADEVLVMLENNNGTFPAKNGFADSGPTRPDGEVRDPFAGLRQPSPELAYESRFFSVLLNDSGAVLSVNTDNIAAIDSDKAADMASVVYWSGKKSGFKGNYRYTVYKSDGSTGIIFLDCTRSLNNFYTVLLLSVGITLAGLAAVFVLLLFLSDRLIHPFIESQQKQKQFIADAGHELKTPLTIINADTEVLELEMGQSEWLDDIRKQTQRLSGLTRDLIYLSRMEEQQTEPIRIDFPISDVVADCATSFAALAKTQNKELAEHITPWLSYCGDERAIRQLTGILLDNALKYSPEATATELSLMQKGKYICLAVTNVTVTPLSRQTLQQMFDRFYRADRSRSTNGYGIGLSIAKAIVSAHKGKISATQNGTQLTICALLPQ